MSGTLAGELSNPLYASGVSVLTSGPRLLVVQDASQEASARLLGQLSADGQQVELVALGAAEAGGDFARLELRVLDLLSTAPLGVRLYVCGDESFLWRVQRLARGTGLLGEEIELIKAGSGRELYCVHCAHLQVIDERSEATCQGCGLHLMVRAHFSRRLGAYMGVCLDPDQPRAEAQA